MSIEGLKYIADEMHSLGIQYAFMEWNSAVVYPYWIGEHSETESFTEDGLQESTLIVTGTTIHKWIDLENDKSKIEHHFRNMASLLPNGNAIAISYAGSLTVPTETAELKRIQINLSIKEWKV